MIVAKEVKLMTLQKGTRPVPRWLVGQCQNPPNLSKAYTICSSSVLGVKLNGKPGVIRTGPQASLRICRLPVWLERGQGQTHSRALADPEYKDLETLKIHFCGFCILLTTEVVPKIFPNHNVIAHLVVHAGWGSCLLILAIFSKWCHSNQVDFRHPHKVHSRLPAVLVPGHKVAGTIDGYRSAISDKLGNSPINVSKDENLAQLLDSFHRNKPKGRRGIPSWNLSLVLQQLTKAPFEPLTEASLKHLAFKTVFLVVLGFGASARCPYPSPRFLSKNQLAKEGRDSVAPVVIPALAPTLDKSLKGDRSLCPVRALH